MEAGNRSSTVLILQLLEKDLHCRNIQLIIVKIQVIGLSLPSLADSELYFHFRDVCFGLGPFKVLAC